MATPSLIIGCGDVGHRVALRLIDQGQHVSGLTRSADSLTRLAEYGLECFPADLDNATTLQDIPAKNADLYYFAPPPADGTTDPRMHNALSALRDALPQRIVYISTSGVYGDCSGEWVDETWPANPQTGRAIRRWDAEQQLTAWSKQTGVDVVVLRVGGIYGPGRLPIERIPSMTVICPDEAPYSNRIHADDLAAACIAAMRQGKPGNIYNATDGHPTTMTDYLYQVADRAGIKRPACASLKDADNKLSPAMLSFVRESRRMDNAKMLRELGLVLQYPTLEQGLDSCF